MYPVHDYRHASVAGESNKEFYNSLKKTRKRKEEKHQLIDSNWVLFLSLEDVCELTKHTNNASLSVSLL
jgi:hypothetical protein